MNEVLHPRMVSCPNCGTPTKPRQTPFTERNGTVVMEARWICPKCTSAFKRAIVQSDK